MRSAIPVDFQNPDHRALLFDLACTNKDNLLNDYDNDIILIIKGYEEAASNGECHPFIAVIDGALAGCFWIEVYNYETGRPRGALLPEFRNIKNLIYFLNLLTCYAFDFLELRKLDCELPLYVRRDRMAAAVEKVIKRIGFQKVGISREAFTVDGRPKDTLLLDYLKRDYDVKKEKQQQEQCATSSTATAE